MLKKFALLGAAALAAGLSAGAAQAQDYFAGKTLTFVVGYDPGGGTDTNWRTIAEFFGKHVPGNPTVIVQNMAGGSGNNAANFVYERARPDGLTVLTGPWNAMGKLTGAPGMRFDYNDMGFVGGFTGPSITYVRTDVVEGGLKDPRDIVKADKVRLAGLRPDSTHDLMSRLSLDMLGVEIVYITGYPGAAQRRAAILSQEADATNIGYNEFRAAIEPTSVATGDVIGLYYHSAGKLDYIDNVPYFPDLYREVKGEDPSGSQWQMLQAVYNAIGVFQNAMFTPPDTPPEALDALRIGWEGLMNDEDYRRVSIERFGDMGDFVNHERGRQAIDELLGKPDPELVKELQAYIASGS